MKVIIILFLAMFWCGYSCTELLISSTGNDVTSTPIIRPQPEVARQPQMCPSICTCDNSATVTCNGKITTEKLKAIVKEIDQMTSILTIEFADFEVFCSELFEGFGKLRLLRILGGRIKTFPRNIGKYLPNLEGLEILKNLIKTISKGSFADLKRLQNLDLSGNKISRIQRSTFENLEDIRIISLDSNLLASIDSRAFETLKEFRLLDVSMNCLQSIELDFFNQFQNPSIFKFGGNHIETIPNGLFDVFSDVLFLGLEMNKIKTIGNSAFSALQPDITSLGIDLSNNPIICNNELQNTFSLDNILVPVISICVPAVV